MITVLLILLLTRVSVGQITPCTPGGKLLDSFQINNCDPNSVCHITAGSTLTATAIYTPSAAISTIPIVRTVKLASGVILSVANYEGCNYVQCPLVANVPATISTTVTVSSFTPRGSFILQCQVNTVDQICFNMPIEID